MRQMPHARAAQAIAGLAMALFILTGHAQTAKPTGRQSQSNTPLAVKAVIVTMFETGQDTGDTPGEFQHWVEREKLDTVYPLPAGYHNVRANARGLIGTVVGVGTARAAASIMALGTDPRFDLTHAYWLVNGIAGIDPNDGSIGSAVWAQRVVDADLAYEIDAREIPGDWSTGYVPLFKLRPYEQPAQNRGEMYALNAPLTEWAYQLTKDTELPDNARMAAYRARFKNYPAAQKPPQVLKGDTLSGGTFWHGKLLNQWANDWVKYWTEGQGNYVTTAMEDTGIMQSLTFLSNAKKVDLNRVMVLRTASDFDSPPPDMTAAESLNRNAEGAYRASFEAYESAYRVGSKVIHTLVDNWPTYRTVPPKVPPH
ncbi:MAG: purine nucleoside permease [Abitibacteriaceae bacterium]|nr:purine nucleoside permease [Abditibacteriaceae bacterium]